MKKILLRKEQTHHLIEKINEGYEKFHNEFIKGKDVIFEEPILGFESGTIGKIRHIDGQGKLTLELKDGQNVVVIPEYDKFKLIDENLVTLEPKIVSNSFIQEDEELEENDFITNTLSKLERENILVDQYKNFVRKIKNHLNTNSPLKGLYGIISKDPFFKENFTNKNYNSLFNSEIRNLSGLDKKIKNQELIPLERIRLYNLPDRFKKRKKKEIGNFVKFIDSDSILITLYYDIFNHVTPIKGKIVFDITNSENSDEINSLSIIKPGDYNDVIQQLFNFTKMYKPLKTIQPALNEWVLSDPHQVRDTENILNNTKGLKLKIRNGEKRWEIKPQREMEIRRLVRDLNNKYTPGNLVDFLTIYKYGFLKNNTPLFAVKFSN